MRISLPVTVALLALLTATPLFAGVISTFDQGEVAAFQNGRTVLGFDEFVIGPSPCFIVLDPNEYLSLGIVIRAKENGSSSTHVATVPHCGSFGPYLSPPNAIGGGSTASDPNWREAIRFEFPQLATAIGAHNDGTGSHTTLTAYDEGGAVIASVSGDEGAFMGIEEPGIAYALWTWDFDQSIPGFALDNVTFSIVEGIPALGPIGLWAGALLLHTAGTWCMIRWRASGPTS